MSIIISNSIELTNFILGTNIHQHKVYLMIKVKVTDRRWRSHVKVKGHKNQLMVISQAITFAVIIPYNDISFLDLDIRSRSHVKVKDVEVSASSECLWFSFFFFFLYSLVLFTPPWNCGGVIFQLLQFVCLSVSVCLSVCLSDRLWKKCRSNCYTDFDAVFAK